MHSTLRDATHHTFAVVLHARKKEQAMKILLANKKNATAQIAHLQFAQANAQTKNCKRAIFPNTKPNENFFII